MAQLVIRVIRVIAVIRSSVCFILELASFTVDTSNYSHYQTRLVGHSNWAARYVTPQTPLRMALKAKRPQRCRPVSGGRLKSCDKSDDYHFRDFYAYWIVTIAGF